MMAGNPRKITVYIIHEKAAKGKWQKELKMKFGNLSIFSGQKLWETMEGNKEKMEIFFFFPFSGGGIE